MEPILVVRQTFWELEEEQSNIFSTGRLARSFSDSDIRYGGDHVLMGVPEDCVKKDIGSPSSKATAETCSSAASSRDWAESCDESLTDTESNESEIGCVSPLGTFQCFVMSPMGPVLMPFAQTNMIWGHGQGVQGQMLPKADNKARSCIAPPPGNLSCSPPAEVQVEPERTTVVFRNLPSHLSRSELVIVLDNAGFGSKYDFVYLPTNFRSMTVFGYAIVNFSDPADALAAFEKFRGAKVDGQELITEWSNSQQGYDVLVNRYRDSPVMHSSVPEKHKPIILANGCPLPFPPSTELLQPPRKFAPTQV